MSFEELEEGIAEAAGKANAILSIVLALVATLGARGIVTKADIASFSGDAAILMEPLKPTMTPEALKIAESVLRGLSSSLTKAVTQH